MPLEIRGTFPLRPQPSDYRRCVWCQTGTTTLMETPGRSDLGAVPLHAICAAEIIEAFRRWRSGGLSAGDPLRGRLTAVKLLGPSG